MGRPPIGPRAMTTAERQRRFWAKLLAPAPGRHRADAISLAHIARHPGVVAVLILDQLGRQTATRLRDALDAKMKIRAKGDEVPDHDDD
jgi:hypothetical protein